MPKGKTRVEHHGLYHHAGWPKDTFWTWFAGFFDGEGNIRTTADGVELAVSSITRDVIESIHRYIGVGYIEEITYDSDRWNVKYTLRIRRWADARTVLIKMRPYLTIKVDACDKAFVRIAQAAARDGKMKMRHADAPLFVRNMKRYQQHRNSSPSPGGTTRRRLTPK